MDCPACNLFAHLYESNADITIKSGDNIAPKPHVTKAIKNTIVIPPNSISNPFSICPFIICPSPTSKQLIKQAVVGSNASLSGVTISLFICQFC